MGIAAMRKSNLIYPSRHSLAGYALSAITSTRNFVDKAMRKSNFEIKLIAKYCIG